MHGAVFIADDFGLSEPVNSAVIRAHREGALHGASLMVGQPATAHAVQLATENPSLRIGWHLHLCDSTPTTRPAWPWGASSLRAGLAIGWHLPSQQFARRELQRQWQLFEATGLRCEFVNSHHHLHVHPGVLRLLDAVIPSSFAGWLRGFDLRWFGRAGPEGWIRPLACRWLRRWKRTPKSDTLWGLDRLHRMDAEEIRMALLGLRAGRHEFVFHPLGVGRDADTAALLGLKNR